MAFIYRADKDPNIFRISSSVVGPGEYLDILPKFSPRQNQEPFLSSSDKLPDPINQTPGPGTYYKDTQRLNNMKNLEKSAHNKNIDLIIARVKNDIITLRPSEKLGFDTKAKRFNFNSAIKSNAEFNITPGPGHYFPSILNKVKSNRSTKRFDSNKSKISFLKLKARIPMEKQGFETVVIESDKNKFNNKLRKTFQYDNFACRPKIFNIRKFKEIMENNENNTLSSTNYSDQKNRTKFNKFMRTYEMSPRGFNNFKEMNNSYNNNNNEEIKEMYEYYKNKDSENKNAMKFRINFCKKVNQKKLKKKSEDNFDNLIEGKTPGPGYYFEDLIHLEPHSKKLKNTKIQNFGSKVKRFHALKKPWTDLSPGEYIQVDMEKNEKTNKNKENPKNINVPFGSKEKRNNTFLCLEKTLDNPGPGDYEYKPFTGEIDKEGLIDTQFGFTGERFNDKYIMKDKYNNPGPAYYKLKINSIWYKNKKIKNRSESMLLNQLNLNDKSTIKKVKVKKNKFLNGKFSSLDEFKFRENVPPVGYYYPEYFSTIEYKNRLNLMNANNSDIYFNKSINKVLKKNDSAPNIVGPGYYNIDRDPKGNIYYNNEIHPPFYSSAPKKASPDKKKKYRVDLEEIGKFYMKEYFKWNKKSFNVLFV